MTQRPEEDPASASRESVEDDEAQRGTEEETLPDITEVAEVLEGLPPEQAGTLEAYLHFSAPLPPPDWFAGYERVVSGAADRILTMAENEQGHRHDMNRRTLEEEAGAARHARWLGFTLAVIVLGGAIYLLAVGKSVEGLVTLLPALGGLIALFLRGERRDEQTADEQG